MTDAIIQFVRTGPYYSSYLTCNMVKPRITQVFDFSVRRLLVGAALHAGASL